MSQSDKVISCSPCSTLNRKYSPSSPNRLSRLSATLFEDVAIRFNASMMDSRESLMVTTSPRPVPMLRTRNCLRSGNCRRPSSIRSSHGLLHPKPASMNSISSRPSLIGLKKVVAADVARATCQIVHELNAVEVSYVLNRVGSVSRLSLVIARTALPHVSERSHSRTSFDDIRFRASRVPKEHITMFTCFNCLLALIPSRYAFRLHTIFSNCLFNCFLECRCGESSRWPPRKNRGPFRGKSLLGDIAICLNALADCHT